MHHDADISILSEEVASLRTLVQEQAAELAALRQATGPDSPVSRRHLMRGLAGLGAAGLAGMVATAEPAAAADGDNLVLGVDNASTAGTRLTHTSQSSTSGAGLNLSSDDLVTLFVASREGSGTQWAIIASALGQSQDANAINAEAGGGFALYGSNTSSWLPAVAGVNNGSGAGLGGGNTTGGPQLLLQPAPDSLPGHPTAGGRTLGEIRLDILGDLWVCVEDGTPGTWTRLLREDTAAGRVIPVTPFRALDTRAAGGRAAGAPVIPGQLQGPLTNGQVVTLDLAGVAPIPATATGVVGNVTVANNTSAGRLQVLPAGTTPPTATSTLNFTANAHQSSFTSGLSATGLSTLATLFSPGGTYHLILDITAYIT